MKMSGQWEVVGKTKKKPNTSKTKTDQKPGTEKSSIDVDILPLSQVQSQFDVLRKDIKENTKPGKENHAKNKTLDKPQKKLQNKKKDPPKDKPALPKCLETAVKLLHKKQLSHELESSQAKFPDSPLVWLKGLIAYLNTRLTVENVHPVFEGKPPEYPQNILPVEIRDKLKRSLLGVNEGISQTLFEWCLTATASDISRGDKGCESVLGYKLAAQMLAFDKPSLVVTSIPKVKTLLASYQNRQPIGLSLLWIAGVGGFRDLSIGLRVWKEVMFPLIEYRLYSSYVLRYLRLLLGCRTGSKPLEAEEIVSLLHLFCSPPDNVPSNRRKEFQELSSLFLKRVLELPYENHFLRLFPTFLRLLDDAAPARLQREVENFLLMGIFANPQVCTRWLEIYPQFFSQSRLLLTHLGKSWNKVPTSLYSKLKKMLNGFQSINRSREKQGVTDNHMQACERLSKELQQRMASGGRGVSGPAANARAAGGGGGGGKGSSSKGGAGHFWLNANLLLLTAIGALLAYDLRTHGSLQASSTGRLLRDLGALPYVEEGWSRTQTFTEQSFRWLQKNGPEYYREVCDFSRPYLATAQELSLTGASYAWACCKTVYSYIEGTTPFVNDWIEQWAPGLKKQVTSFGMQVWNQGKVYSIEGGKVLVRYGQEAVTWAKTNIFIGAWSPDNLQQYSLAVLNATHHYAVGTYDWLYEKVQTLSKVE